MDLDIKKQKEAEFLRKHTLTEQDLRKMIAEKFERARAYDNASKKREILLIEDRQNRKRVIGNATLSARKTWT